MTDNTEYFESEDFKEILRQYEESVKSGTRIYMDADDLADIADYYHCNKREDEAQTAISLAIEYNPEAVGPMLYKAREALEAKDFQTAKEYADKIKILDPLEALYLHAELMILTDDVDGADKILTDYLKNVPTDEQFDFVTDVIQLYIDYENFTKSLEWLVRIPCHDSVIIKELLARTLFGLGQYKDSERLFNELLDKNPYSVEYWNALSGVQYMKEDLSSALSSSEYALAINPDDTNGLLSKANTLFKMANYEEALVYFKKYAEKVPDDEYSYLQEAICLINLNKLPDGIRMLQKAISVAPVTSTYLPDIYIELSFVYNRLGDLEKALWCLNMTDQLDCDHAHIMVIKGYTFLTNQREEEAKIAFGKARELAEDDRATRLQIIVAYLDTLHLDYAYELFTKFFKDVDTDWQEGYSYMALCCKELNKNDEFLYYLKKACTYNAKEAQIILSTLFPEDMNPHDYYEYALEHLND